MSQFFKDREEIEQWLKQMLIKRYAINDDLSVDVNGSAPLNSKKLKSFPVQFGKIEGNFWCASNNLISLKGCPKYVYGTFTCSDNKLTSIENCPSYVTGIFYCQYNKITSLKDIHKHLREPNRHAIDFVNNPIKSHILGVFFIKGLSNIVISNNKVQDIVNKHLMRNRDVHACQEELIKAGFAEYAKL